MSHIHLPPSIEGEYSEGNEPRRYSSDPELNFIRLHGWQALRKIVEVIHGSDAALAKVAEREFKRILERLRRVPGRSRWALRCRQLAKEFKHQGHRGKCDCE
jgi:hypothetical protein